MSIIAALLATTLTSTVLSHYDEHESKQLVPMLSEVLRFPTYAGNVEAHAAQKAWLVKTAKELGFTSRDAGKITEIELPGPEGAPILGLVIHGDVVTVDAAAWTFPPFEGRVADGHVFGRGAVDDKGPLVQALLAMKALKESRIARTHTIRLLVGSGEESDSSEIPEYLKTHAPPDYSLVLDSVFPVVVGEKAWDALGVATIIGERGESPLPYTVVSLEAGLSLSIVPDRAKIRLRWKPGVPRNWDPVIASLRNLPMDEGTRLTVGEGADADEILVVAQGRSAHAGANIAGGRNALVALARALEGKLPPGGADDLLAFARVAGQDLYGTGLGITGDDPLWGRYAVNVATVEPSAFHAPKTRLHVNLRRTPPRTGAQLLALLEQFVRDMNARTGASLSVLPDESYFLNEPLRFDPKGKLVVRLLAAYERATGQSAKPAISGGSSYAKRLPNAIAFGMWFPEKPYPGHDVDEKISIHDLHRGARVLIDAMTDLATGKKIEGAFVP